MNKTVTVNLGGIVFHIDENAYDALQKYLNSIKSHFTSAEGRDEIMQDIEARIAEMFLERTKENSAMPRNPAEWRDKQVITMTDVEEVTVIMGKPEDFEETAPPPPKGGSQASQSAERESPPLGGGGAASYSRRLFRNPDDKVIGGVSSGIAAYFNIDVVIIRIIWAVLLIAFGTGILLYFILWIVMPEAKTTAEKLQMRGEPVNVSNIEKNIKEEAEAIKKKMEQWGKEHGRRAGTGIGRFFEAIGEILRAIFSFIGKIVLAFFAVIGIVVCFALLAGLLGILGLPGIHISNIAEELFNNHSQLLWGYIGLMLAIGIPFLMLVIRAIGGIFNVRTNSKYLSGTALSLCILGVVLCFFIGINLIKEFSKAESVTRQTALVQPLSDTLILKSTGASNEYSEHKYRKRLWSKGIHINDDVFDCNKVEFDIAKNEGNQITLVKMMTASGSTSDQARERATHTVYSFQQKDSLLIFDTDFTLPAKEKYRRQEVQLILRVPVGKYIYIDESMGSILHNVDNVKGILDADMAGRTWKMTDRGLICTDCTGNERTKYSYDSRDMDVPLTVDIEGPDSSVVKVYKDGTTTIRKTVKK